MDKRDDSQGELILPRRAVLQGSLAGMLAVPAFAALSEPAAAQNSGLSGGMVRCVVTGNNAQGKSVVFKEDMFKRSDVWDTDAKTPLGEGFPSDTHKLLPTVGQKDMPMGGTRAYFFTIQPAKAPLDRAKLTRWERSASLVYIYFTSGEVTYVMDDSEVKMRAGDVLVQRNGQHTWHNHTDAPASAFAVKIQV